MPKLSEASIRRKDNDAPMADMQHRHFATIARIIREEFAGDDRERIAETFAHRLQATNSNFSYARFVDAATGVS